MDNVLALAAAKSACYVIPPYKMTDSLPFDAFTPGLYSPSELFDTLENGDFENYLDRKIYTSFIEPVSKDVKPVDIDVILLRRIHDWSISEALDDILDLKTRLRSVAIMGGHDVPRDTQLFATVASLTLELSQTGYLIITGGGPGLMEAANLGAYCAGFEDPRTQIAKAISCLSDAPTYNHRDWLRVSFEVWRNMGPPISKDRSRNIGIPTWFYGHEPPNIFATDIAKYFENSIREEGLLAFASGGIIFAEGNGGTVQEIFQDACQNYYQTYDKKKSPMILFGTEYWAPTIKPLSHNPKDKRKNVYQVLEKLAAEKGFSDLLLITDDTSEIMKFIKARSPL